MSRTLLVEGAKIFRVTIPDEAKVTFGPWSPGGDKARSNYDEDRSKNGTLRIYADKSAGASILGVWSGIRNFREDTLEYSEQVAREEGAILWNSDKNGYTREDKVKRSTDWTDPLTQHVLEAGTTEKEGA